MSQSRAIAEDIKSISVVSSPGLAPSDDGSCLLELKEAFVKHSFYAFDGGNINNRKLGEFLGCLPSEPHQNLRNTLNRLKASGCGFISGAKELIG